MRKLPSWLIGKSCLIKHGLLLKINAAVTLSATMGLKARRVDNKQYNNSKNWGKHVQR